MPWYLVTPRAGIRRPLSQVDQFAGLVTCTTWLQTMATSNVSARVALFDNRNSENPKAPVMTGKIEVPVDQIDALYEQLLEQEVQSYGERKFVTLDLSLWHYDGQSNALLFTGRAQTPRQKADTDDILPAAPDAAPKVIRHEQTMTSPEESDLTATIKEAAKVDVHGNPVDTDLIPSS